VAPPGFCNRGEVRYGSIGGLEYEVPQSRLYCLCINVAVCSTALQCICRVIRRSSMTMKAHTYYIIFERPPMGGSFRPPPWRRHCLPQQVTNSNFQKSKLLDGRHDENQLIVIFVRYYCLINCRKVWHTIRYDTRCYFNVRSKADMSA